MVSQQIFNYLPKVLYGESGQELGGPSSSKTAGGQFHEPTRKTHRAVCLLRASQGPAFSLQRGFGEDSRRARRRRREEEDDDNDDRICKPKFLLSRFPTFPYKLKFLLSLFPTLPRRVLHAIITPCPCPTFPAIPSPISFLHFLLTVTFLPQLPIVATQVLDQSLTDEVSPHSEGCTDLVLL